MSLMTPSDAISLFFRGGRYRQFIIGKGGGRRATAALGGRGGEGEEPIDSPPAGWMSGTHRLKGTGSFPIFS